MLAVHTAVELVAAAGLVVALVAAGARLRRLLRLPVRPGLRLPVDLVVGAWVLGCLVLALGLTHALHVGALVAVSLGLALTGRWRRTEWRSGPLLAPAAGALVALPVAMAPPFFYDALVYHLGLPWQALLEGGLHAHPEDLFSTFPPLAQLVATPALAVGLDRVPALLHWSSFVAAGAAAGALARTLGAPRWAGWLAVACVPLLPGDALVAGLPAAEGWALAGMFASAAVAFGSRRDGGAALAVGLLAGIATSARLQGLAWSGLVVALVVLRARGRWRSAAAAACGWLVGSAPWWVKNFALLGSPFAPVGWRRVGMDTLWRDAGVVLGNSSSPSAAVGQVLAALAPHAGYVVPLALAATLAVVTRRRQQTRLAALLALGAFAAWVLTGTLPRFLSPALGVLLALAAAAAGTGRPGRWAAGLALATTAAFGLTAGVTELRRISGLGFVVGTHGVDPRWIANDPRPAFAAAGRLPPDARVLFVGEPRGFDFPRPFVAPSQHDESPVRAALEAGGSPADVSKNLRGQGFTHLLVNWGELGRLAANYPVAPWRDPRGWRRWNAFVASLGPPVLGADGVQVFVLPGQSGRGV